MGGGSYSSVSRSVRSNERGFATNTVQQNFKSREIQRSMDPINLGIRESRDSEEHPASLAIILALDVTGSMLDVPQKMVRDGLPHIMTNIMQAGIPDPQVLFLGIGDHECDTSPIQVSQFESSDELLDKWLTDLWMERGGGGNDGESYMLAHYIAANHTQIDCWEKRKQKGFLFTIGDEKCLPSISHFSIEKNMGKGQYSDFSTEELIAQAQERYHVYHIHTMETGAGKRRGVIEHWKDLLGQNVLVVESHTEIPQLIAEIVAKNTDAIVASGTGVVEAIPVPKDSGSTEGVDDNVTML
jgi:hypothetical protein